MKTIRLALDWTPNTIHTGFFVAKNLNFYNKENIALEIILPDKDNYTATPAKKLAENLVHFAIAPSESVISYQLKNISLKAIAALLAKDASAIVTLKNSGLNRPQRLSGKIYASYKARFEDHIVKKMIENDGGDDDLKIVYPPRLGIWNVLLNGDADATWVFLPWEGVEAKMNNVELNAFRLEDFDIPYGYSPVIMINENHRDLDEQTIKRFLQATIKGYEYALDLPEEAAKILIKEAGHPKVIDEKFIIESQLNINNYYKKEGSPFGLMEEKVWRNFVSWLKKEDLFKEQNIDLSKIDHQKLFTNEYNF